MLQRLQNILRERERVDRTFVSSSFEAHLIIYRQHLIVYRQQHLIIYRQQHLIIYRQQHLIIYRQQHLCHTQSVTDTG